MTADQSSPESLGAACPLPPAASPGVNAKISGSREPRRSASDELLPAAVLGGEVPLVAWPCTAWSIPNGAALLLSRRQQQARGVELVSFHFWWLKSETAIAACMPSFFYSNVDHWIQLEAPVRLVCLSVRGVQLWSSSSSFFSSCVSLSSSTARTIMATFSSISLLFLCSVSHSEYTLFRFCFRTAKSVWPFSLSRFISFLSLNKTMPRWYCGHCVPQAIVLATRSLCNSQVIPSLQKITPYTRFAFASVPCCHFFVLCVFSAYVQMCLYIHTISLFMLSFQLYTYILLFFFIILFY